MKTNVIFRRIGAYLIDYTVITLISMAIISIPYINPNHDKYQELSKGYNDLLDSYYAGDITSAELSNEVSNISYDLNKAGYIYIISDMVIAFLYFGVFAYVTKGQTLGKKLLSIKIVNKDEKKEVKLYQYFLRVLILCSIIPNILILIGLCFSKNTYMTMSLISGNLDRMLLLVIFIMIIGTKEGRGLHDFIAGTKVIDLKQSTNTVLEAKIRESKEKNIKEETETDESVIIKPKKRKNRKKKENE